MYYKETLYSGATLQEAAEEYLAELPPNITVLVSGGSSGCALASAMLVIASQKGRSLSHCAVYTREASKERHRELTRNTELYSVHSGIGGSVPMERRCFVDDLIDTGETVKSVYQICPFKYALVNLYQGERKEIEDCEGLETILILGEITMDNECKRRYQASSYYEAAIMEAARTEAYFGFKV